MNDIKASPAYVGRFQRVCLYIENHLDEPLTLEALSAIAYSSPYHFTGNLARIPAFRCTGIFSGYACGAPVGAWPSTRTIKSSILPLMPDFKIRSRSVAPSVPRLIKARLSSVSDRIGPSGIDAYRNIRYRSKLRWT